VPQSCDSGPVYYTILLHLFWAVCTWYSYSCWLILPVERQLSCSFLFRAFSCSNYVFNFPTKCTCTSEYSNCLPNICNMFRPSLRHHQGVLLSLLRTICLL
jgi:hypothetical protein